MGESGICSHLGDIQQHFCPLFKMGVDSFCKYPRMVQQMIEQFNTEAWGAELLMLIYEQLDAHVEIEQSKFNYSIDFKKDGCDVSAHLKKQLEWL